jgi:transcriptional regulator with XRE-family HTH domain
MSIGERIKELRKQKGLAQWELAEEIGSAQNTISSWETDRTEPTVFNCIVIADYFGITLDELCRGEIK